MAVTYRYSVAKYSIKSDQFLTINPENLFAPWKYPDDCRICFLPSHNFWMSYVWLQIKKIHLLIDLLEGWAGALDQCCRSQQFLADSWHLECLKTPACHPADSRCSPSVSWKFLWGFEQKYIISHCTLWGHNTWKTYVDHTVWVLSENHKSRHLDLFRQPHCFQAQWHVNGTPIENSR